MFILKMKSKISEIKTLVDKFKRTMDMAKERIRELEDSSVGNIHIEERRETRKQKYIKHNTLGKKSQICLNQQLSDKKYDQRKGQKQYLKNNG